MINRRGKAVRRDERGRGANDREGEWIRCLLRTPLNDLPTHMLQSFQTRPFRQLSQGGLHPLHKEGRNLVRPLQRIWIKGPSPQIASFVLNI